MSRHRATEPANPVRPHRAPELQLGIAERSTDVIVARRPLPPVPPVAAVVAR